MKELPNLLQNETLTPYPKAHVNPFDRQAGRTSRRDRHTFKSHRLNKHSMIPSAQEKKAGVRVPQAKAGATLTSLVWRLLTRYGQIKYRYLLPVYQFFRLGPDRRKPASTARPSKTLSAAQTLVRALNRFRDTPSRDQLDVVIERVESSRGAVIFLPSVGWEIVNTQRVHHLAREFARQGFVSIFDSSNAFDDVNGFKETEPNLFLFRGEGVILREIPDPILWAFTFNFDRRDSYPASTRTVYDWVDDLSVFPYERGFLESNHSTALKDATLVLTTAHRLHEQALAVRPDAVYLPNGVEEGHFADDSLPVPGDCGIASLLGEGKPIAGFYGALADWVDYELIEEVACLRPDWNFLLIGPALDLSLHQRGRRLLKLSNVRWIGPRPYQSLPAYLRLFDVAMIPFVINNVTLATSPLKLYEYFAGGKPVVATPLPECQAFDDVRVVTGAQEFSKALDPALGQGHDEEFRRRLRDLARENSWTARVQLLLEHLHKKRETGCYGSTMMRPRNSATAALQDS